MAQVHIYTTYAIYAIWAIYPFYTIHTSVNERSSQPEEHRLSPRFTLSHVSRGDPVVLTHAQQARA